LLIASSYEEADSYRSLMSPKFVVEVNHLWHQGFQFPIFQIFAYKLPQSLPLVEPPISGRGALIRCFQFSLCHLLKIGAPVPTFCPHQVHLVTRNAFTNDFSGYVQTPDISVHSETALIKVFLNSFLDGFTGGGLFIQAVNTALIDLYWQIGATISRKIEAAEWGNGVVDRLAQFIARTEPGLRGLTRRNLFRMKQFYEAYREDSTVSPLVAQLPWSHHLLILGQSKRPEEREFYVRLAIRERCSPRIPISIPPNYFLLRLSSRKPSLLCSSMRSWVEVGDNAN
jgi:predicted nuclease of restriction endonuclease-like (RecB) superfamily